MRDKEEARQSPTSTGSLADVPVWINSLAPVGVAFVCFVSIILAAGIEQQGKIIAYGAAAAFIGLECYWILRGLRDEHFGTMVTGFIGAGMAVLALDLYLLQIQG